jgi:O-antigen/teichoic acid export membrane protein
MLSGRLISSVVPSLIAHFLGVRNVTYYSVTQRSVDYAGEGIGRIGLITAPRASDWMARGMTPQIVRTARYGNKYALTLWGVFATFLLIYGPRVFRVWVNADFAEHSGILLIMILAAYTCWFGQFISAAILMGVGRYGEYAGYLMVEAILAVLGFAVTLPFFGLAWGVGVASALLAVNRSLNLGRIFCKEFHLRIPDFFASIYTIPVSLMAVDMLLLWLVKTFWIPGNSWWQLIPLGCINACLYSAIAFLIVLEPEHRGMLLEKVMARLGAIYSRHRLRGVTADGIAKP